MVDVSAISAATRSPLLAAQRLDDLTAVGQPPDATMLQMHDALGADQPGLLGFRTNEPGYQQWAVQASVVREEYGRSVFGVILTMGADRNGLCCMSARRAAARGLPKMVGFMDVTALAVELGVTVPQAWASYEGERHRAEGSEAVGDQASPQWPPPRTQRVRGLQA